MKGKTIKLFSEIKQSFNKVLNVIATSERVSTRYIEGLIYSLLSAVKANDQNSFLNYLITFLNTFNREEISEFMRKLYNVFPLPEESFQKLGYLIIMGFMSIKVRGGE
ncbi:MAG: hypothetical protein ACTSVA_01045 [Candidatus Njordarchaeales archaeon]